MHIVPGASYINYCSTYAHLYPIHITFRFKQHNSNWNANAPYQAQVYVDLEFLASVDATAPALL